jgi:serine/threonine protein kinase
MDAARWERVRTLFQDVFECEPEERVARLDAACGADADLRAAVDRLLHAHGSAGGFLEADRPADLPSLLPLGAREEADARPAPARIGPYRIVREIGRGGMGTVYLAERDEPGLHKVVAAKVVRPGMVSDFVLRRFHTERQILAALEHPGIARLYDGGTTEEGLPFFVMEYVDGENVLDFCDARRSSIDDRLRLFRRVCEAVQFAHRHLVVHRDLKPSNILVTAESRSCSTSASRSSWALSSPARRSRRRPWSGSSLRSTRAPSRSAASL